MKAIFAIVCAAALAASFLITQDTASLSAESQFEEFVATYRKSYLSEESYSYRLGVFKQNLDEIAALNEANPEATYAVNHFADLTVEERQASMGYAPSTQI